MRDRQSELVRVDAQGAIHPIGVVASQALRARRGGVYRLLPSPRHVLFARYTGEDGKRDAEDGAVVRLAGEITAAGAICDVMAMVGQLSWKGELVVESEDQHRSIFFDRGNVVGIRSDVPNERLGEVLYRFGALSESQHQEALRRVKEEGTRFGEVAVELGYVKRELVYKYIGRQVEEVVYSAMRVADGTFFFLDGYDESAITSRHVVSAGALLMDGVTRMDEMRFFRERIPSSEHVPVLLPVDRPPPEELEFALAAVDGKRSVAEIGRVTGQGEFAITKDLFALVQSKHVAIKAPPPVGGTKAIIAAANGALSRIFVVAQRHGIEGAVRGSLEAFAVGAGVIDILIRGAGPLPDGTLIGERVEENSGLLAAGADREPMLQQLLHDYVSFALFSVGGMVPAEEDGLLQAVVSDLETLRPAS